jgi:hypothetical protein
MSELDGVYSGYEQIIAFLEYHEHVVASTSLFVVYFRTLPKFAAYTPMASWWL